MSAFRSRPPAWFWIAVAVLLLWGLMGAASFVMYWQLGGDAMGTSAYDRALWASMPGWYVWIYLIATVTGLAGAVALALRRRTARPLFLVSLVAVAVQFGYVFLATDLIAVKGVWTTYFPAAIFAIGAFQLWFAGLAGRRGWLI